ncbi:MAG: DUF4145 domain-containing protein [Bacteroidia bacterium]|nr:DUF4145 domain-containing protein [Bacteroidia bacterium]
MKVETKYFCRNCKGARNHSVLYEKKLKGSDEEYSFHWIDSYFVIECAGCETLSFLKVYGDSEMYYLDEEGEQQYEHDVKIFPNHLEGCTELEYIHLLPPTIKAIYEETIIALKAKAFILTAGGLRAIIEAICNHLKIKKNDLSNRIDLLHEKGFLTINESRRLHSIRFLGNDALHEIKAPKKEQIFTLLEIVNHLLENLFIADNKIGHNIDRLIDKYEEFIKLLRNKISKEQIYHEMTLKNILGKSLRLIRPKEFKEFERRLKEDINKGVIDYLSIINIKDPLTFKILKMPESFFDFS